MSSIMSTDVAFEGTLSDENSGSMVDQWKGVLTRSSMGGALVFENEYMFAGKGCLVPSVPALAA